MAKVLRTERNQVSRERRKALDWRSGSTKCGGIKMRKKRDLIKFFSAVETQIWC